uniref:Sushi domain-containing protein n=1 Tax=Myripristis murdjan TaxID=586833 RepID=A0A667WWG4_9TELE
MWNPSVHLFCVSQRHGGWNQRSQIWTHQTKAQISTGLKSIPCFLAQTNLFCLLLFLSSECQCSCSDLPHIPLTEPPPDDCCQNNLYRYKCVDGYIRKPGTSTLAKCIESKWDVSFACIRKSPHVNTQNPVLKSKCCTLHYTSGTLAKITN